MSNRETDFSRLELDLPNCLDNYRYFRSKLERSTRMLVLVKANAYGHGAVEFASMMQNAGADYLAVALPLEGVELRQAGISLPILVLTAGMDFFDEIVDNRLEPGIPNLPTLLALEKVLAERGLKDYPVHIKLDTGMHRLGFMTHELDALLAHLGSTDLVKVQSVYSHLCVAEDPAMDDFTRGQIRMFEENAARVEDAIGYHPILHILNSAGIERFTWAQHDMVRLGVGIYGISALPDVKLKSVASLKVKILQVCWIAGQWTANINNTANHTNARTLAQYGSKLLTVITADDSTATAHELEGERTGILQNPQLWLFIQWVMLHQGTTAGTSTATDINLTACRAVTSSITSIALYSNKTASIQPAYISRGCTLYYNFSIRQAHRTYALTCISYMEL